MAGIWPTPINGACPAASWYSAGGGCPDQLRVQLSSLSRDIAVDFAGRGKVGLACGGSDTYLTVGVGGDVIYIDVWAARRAGVWSSSVTIDVYAAAGSALSDTVEAYPSFNFSAVVSKSITDEVAGCGTVVKATITVNDDGTFSIA